MLQPLMHILASKRIILASGSPRRKQILENIGLNVEVVVSNFEENLDKSLFASPSEYATQNALLKALQVARQLMHDMIPPSIIIGADTVVTLDNAIFEKPCDAVDAYRMLSTFSGRKHSVCSGVVILAPLSGSPAQSGDINDRFQIDKFHAVTEVEFDELSPEVINAYIATGEPMDKAGGYGIQAIGGTLIKSICGDYFNVMGFPVHLFSKQLQQFILSSERGRSTVATVSTDIDQS